MTYRPTRAQILRGRIFTALLLAGVAAAWWAVGVALGGHPRLHLVPLQRLADQLHSRRQPPLLLGAPRDLTAWIALSGLLTVAWAVALHVLMYSGHPDPRRAGLPGWGALRGRLSARAVRRTGRWTRPGLGWWARRREPLTGFGYPIGRLRGTRHRLWADFEVRCRIVARTGWGKTSRLLVPVARTLPGAALIGSTAADLFEQTVVARQARGPVWVVDFTDRAHRYAAGYPGFCWSPIPGCGNYSLALRRARAIVAGAQDEQNTDNTYFRLAATEVIAAWLHAAALGRLGIDDVVRWQQNITLTQPRDVIDRHSGAEPVAKLAMVKHLDERAARTTSNTERFLQLALAPFATREGAAFTRPGPGIPGLEQLVAEQATLYLLATPQTAPAISPLLTMLADEWFYAAQAQALRCRGTRLPVPAVAVLDELRRLVPIPSLPAVAAEMRKYGIGLLYAIQNAGQERELYGEQAASLAQNVQLTILGGYDQGLAEQISAQSGQVEVPAVTASGGLLSGAQFSEGAVWRPLIDAADQQRLRDGDSVVRLAGMPLFYAHTPSFRSRPLLARRIRGEERAVRARVAAAQAAATAEAAAFDALAAAAYGSTR